MKKQLLFGPAIALLLVASAALASDYSSALNTAKRENKPLLLYFYSNSCGYCVMMDKKTLADKDVAAMLKKDFVFLRVDADSGVDAARLYRIPGTPTSWFLDSSGQGLGEVPGYIPPKEFKLILEYIKGKRYNDTDLETYLKKASAKK